MAKQKAKLRKVDRVDEKPAKLDWLLISISMSVVLGIVALLYAFPAWSELIVFKINRALTEFFGSFVLFFVFIALILLIILAASKYGSIRLGNKQPEYSTFSWVAMIFSAGFGSAIFWWALVEWAYYIQTPGLGIDPHSQRAYSMAVPYVLFHWGSSWTVYVLAALPICYHFHVRGNEGLSLSAIVSAITGLRKDGLLCRLVDILFIFLCFGALSITLAISVPLITRIFCDVLGISPSFYMNVGMILAISFVYSFSSYLGIERGMRKISDLNVKFALAFIFGVFALGPTSFIIKNIVYSLGLVFNNFLEMSLWTDPFHNAGFPESWTIFFWLYAVTYAPFTGIFVAKVSRGRTIRALIVNTVGSGTAGALIFFGVLSSFSLHRELKGMVNVVEMVNAGNHNAAVLDLLKTLPIHWAFMILACIVMILFLATTLDAAAFTMSSTSTKNMKEDSETSPFLRLFWCIMLSLVPLTMILIKANLDTIKTAAVATATPILLIMILMLYGSARWMFSEYGNKSAHDIEDKWKLKDNSLQSNNKKRKD